MGVMMLFLFYYVKNNLYIVFELLDDDFVDLVCYIFVLGVFVCCDFEELLNF